MHTKPLPPLKRYFVVIIMPRKDPTFTDNDLLRFYCTNLDPAEKYRVRKKFKENILHRKAICPDDEDESDYCAWTKALHKVTAICQAVGDWLPEILAVLTAIQMVLNVLSWVGWLGRLLAFFRLIVLLLIEFVIYVGSALVIVGEFSYYTSWLESIFCKEAEMEFELTGDPPDPDSLPPNPASKLVDDLQQAYQDFTNWITTPPDWLDDILP